MPEKQLSETARQVMNQSMNYRDMTLRDHFAARAMQGILSKHDDSTVYDERDLAYDSSSIAHKSYAIADAMLAERQK